MAIHIFLLRPTWGEALGRPKKTSRSSKHTISFSFFSYFSLLYPVTLNMNPYPIRIRIRNGVFDLVLTGYECIFAHRQNGNVLSYSSNINTKQFYEAIKLSRD